MPCFEIRFRRAIEKRIPMRTAWIMVEIGSKICLGNWQDLGISLLEDTYCLDTSTVNANVWVWSTSERRWGCLGRILSLLLLLLRVLLFLTSYAHIFSSMSICFKRHLRRRMVGLSSMDNVFSFCHLYACLICSGLTRRWRCLIDYDQLIVCYFFSLK